MAETKVKKFRGRNTRVCFIELRGQNQYVQTAYFADNANKVYGVIEGKCAQSSIAKIQNNVVNYYLTHKKFSNSAKEAFDRTFKELDELFQKDNETGGLSLIMCHIENSTFHLAWVGEPHAYHVNRNKSWVLETKIHHNMKNSNEKLRVVEYHTKMANKTFIIANFRNSNPSIDGKITVTRGIGFKEYKDVIIADPEYTCIDLIDNPIHKFYIASDAMKIEMSYMEELRKQCRTSKVFCDRLAKSYNEENKKENPFVGIMISFKK